MSPVQRGQFLMGMKPLHGGAYTLWHLEGTVPTAVPAREMSRLIQMLWFWSGWSVELVLPVAVEMAAWLEWWTDAIAIIPEEQLRVGFVAGSSARKSGNHG